MRDILIYALALVPAFFAGAAAAQDPSAGYPAKPVRLVIPFSVGGASDIIARVTSPRLTEMWRQQAIVTRLHADFVKAINTPEARDRVATLGAEVHTLGPEAFGTFLTNEHTKWGKIVRDAGTKIE